MKCQTYRLGSLSKYKYVVVLSEYDGKILLSRHKERTTWETQGGHIEVGETSLDAAKRELFEESGAIDFDIEPVCDYRAWNENTGHGANGVVFKAVIRTLGKLPESEMAEVHTFNKLPDNLTYPAITPLLFHYLEGGDVGNRVHHMKLKAEPFHKIRDGIKTIELRLNDEKRQKVQAGDYIEFTLIDNPSEKLITRVVKLHHFTDFRELYASLPKEKLGYSADETPEPDHMDAYYPKEKQQKYGALGIELRLTDLQKFINAQDNGYDFGDTYETALSEIKNGEKQTHWMWYVFPQIKGLGWSGITAYFSIKDLGEAVDYIQHPILGKRLIDISAELLKLNSCDPTTVMGHPDDFKLRSCMTLFKYAAPNEPIFQQVLDKYCMGTEDDRTTAILNR